MPPSRAGAAAADAGESSPAAMRRANHAGSAMRIGEPAVRERRGQQRQARPAQDEVGEPHGQPGRQPMPFGQRLAAVHHDVIGEDHANAQHERRELPVLAAGGAKGEAQNRKHEARHRDGELLVNLHHLVMRRNALCPHLLGLGVEILDGQLAIAAHRSFAREHAFGIERDNRLLEAQHFVGARIVQLGAMAGAVLEHHLDRAGVAIDHHAAAFGQVDDGLRRIGRVGGEHVAPPGAAGRHLVDIEDNAGEVLEEHARPHFTFGAVHDDPGADNGKSDWRRAPP